MKDNLLISILRDMSSRKPSPYGELWGLHHCGLAANFIESLQTENEQLQADVNSRERIGMANARRLIKNSAGMSNRYLYSELFGTQMTTAHDRCVAIGFNPDNDQTVLISHPGETK